MHPCSPPPPASPLAFTPPLILGPILALTPQVKMMELGIKPVYVFDGKPPGLKSGELAAREEKKQQAELELAAALESGDAEEIRKASHRSVSRLAPPRASRPPPRPAPSPLPRALPRAPPSGSGALACRSGRAPLLAIAGAGHPSDERRRAGAAAAARMPGGPRAV